MPKDQNKIGFVREGETLTKENFRMMMNRFISETFTPDRKREENETELHYVQNVREPHEANVLRANVFMDKLVATLTPEQAQEILNDAPEQGKQDVQYSVVQELTIVMNNLAYRKSKTLETLADGPEKKRLAKEVEAIGKAKDRALEKGRTIDEAKAIVGPYLTKEQMEKVFGIKELFIRNSYEYVSEKVSGMLTPEQMQDLASTADNYIIPWDRKPEEMGEKAYTKESEKAKADIDAMQNLSPEQKEKMKADIDAANNFLREPSKREDPESIYFHLTAAYENAVKHDGEKANKAVMEKEGLQFDVIDEKINEQSFSSDLFVKEGKEEEFKKWQEAEFKFSPTTKESIKHVFSMMQQYGYGGKGFVGEQGTKQYGLSMLAKNIFAYKEAIASGDATKIAETSKAMVEEKEHVDEILGYIREHFPVDRHSDNFGKAGNVDVARNPTFPPQYRMDEAVSTFNSLFMIMNFAQANGLSPDEFLEKPAHYLREFYLDKYNIGLNNALKGKTGGEALFEASKTADKLYGESPTVGAVRVVEGMNFLDTDPAIRLHNHGMSDFFDTALVRNGAEDIRRRAIAYNQGHLDRFLFVTEPRDNASLLGVPIYNSSKMSYDQPEAFNELEYLQNNGRSVAEMKEIFDSNVKEYLLLSVTKFTKDSHGKLISYPAYGTDRLVGIAQQAASKILLAKHAEKNDPAYAALRGILTNGQKYVENLVQLEKFKVVMAQKDLEEATKAGDVKKAEELKAYIDANKAYDKIKVKASAEPAQEYVSRLDALEKADRRRPAGADLKPDEDFNRAMAQLTAKQASLNTRIEQRTRIVGAENAAKDDELQALAFASASLHAEILHKTNEYAEQLEKDVQSGRITASYKDARIKQIFDSDYRYDRLPDYFPPDTDRSVVADFALKHNAEAFGFVNTVPEAPKQAPAEKQAEKEEWQAEFTGKWFEPGEVVTADVLLGKLNALEERFAQPVKGDNWLENSKEVEAREREKQRMQAVINEAWKTISDEGKQQVYALLDENVRKIAEKYNGLEYERIKTNTAAIWEPLIKAIPQDKLQSVALKADATRSGMEEKSVEEAKVARFGDEVGTVRNVVENMAYYKGQPITDEQRKAMLSTLDRAQDMMADLDPQYAKELGTIRSRREESEYGMNRFRKVTAQEAFGKLGYNVTMDPFNHDALTWDGFERESIEVEGDKNTWDIVKPEAQDRYQKLKEFKFEYSDETKKGIKEIFKAFDENGFDKAEFNAEQGTKVYALHKYHAAMGEFYTCIQSDDPADKIKAIEAAEKMQAEYDRIKDLAKKAGDIYGVNEGGFYPGNVDVERESMFPPEFRNDIGGISALNGMYLIYRTLKEQNADVDKFLEDPRAYLDSEVNRLIAKEDVNKSMVGKSGAEAMFETFVQAGNDSTMRTMRLVENLGVIEKDPALREKNILAQFAGDFTGTNLVAEMGNVRNNVWMVGEKHLDRFLMVKEPQQDASLLGAATKDFDKRVIIEPRYFDELEYLSNTREDPQEYLDRVLSEGTKFLQMVAADKERGTKRLTTDNIGYSHGVEAMQKAAFKFLAAHPDLKKGDAYKKLNDLAQKGPEFVKKYLTEQVKKGNVDLDISAIKFGNMENLAPEVTLAEYKKYPEMKNFGEDVRKEERSVNSKLTELKEQVRFARWHLDRGDEDFREALEEAEKNLKAAVDQRKEELLKAFHDGKITEDYLNRRKEEMDLGNFNDVPQMFEADNLLEKGDYLERKYPADKDGYSELDDLTQEEKDEIYQRYVEGAKRSKEQWFTARYLEASGMMSKVPPKTMAERIAEEDARLARIGEAPIKGGAEKQKDAPEVKQEAPKAEKFEVNLDEEEPEVKAEEKVEEKAEEKVEEKVVGDDGGTRFDVELDDDKVEPNNDILNFGGKEKDLGKDPLNKDK